MSKQRSGTNICLTGSGDKGVFEKMEDGSPIWGLTVFGLLVIFMAIVNGFGAAIQNLNVSEIEKRAQDGERKAEKVMKIVENPTLFVNTMLAIVTIVGMITGIYEYQILQSGLRVLLQSVRTAWNPVLLSGILLLIPMFCLLFFVMVLGVLVPKKLGNRYAQAWVFALIDLVLLLCKILHPMTGIISFFSDAIVRVFGVNPNEDYDNVTEEEIMSMVNEGHEQGVLLASEAEMITNIFEFGEKEASDIMTHRKNIIAVDALWTLQETVDFILHENYSRFPVYEEDIDNIIGILHLKDVMIYYQQNPQKKDIKIKEIVDVIRVAHFIPETRNINSLFKEMQSRKIHMEIVVDEYGQTSGLVAMEDILEEIVGNILDEYDDEEEKMIEIQPDGSYLIQGMAELEDVADELHIDFGEEEYDTLNGFLIAKIDRIPQEDDKIDIVYEGYEFQVLCVENKTIRLVRVTNMKNHMQEMDSGEKTIASIED